MFCTLQAPMWSMVTTAASPPEGGGGGVLEEEMEAVVDASYRAATVASTLGRWQKPVLLQEEG
jgi:hypothetical protein